MSLFWYQVSNGAATWALILLKWWARLQFVAYKQTEVSDDTSPGINISPHPGAFYFQDYFGNLPKERAIEYLFVHYLQK